MSHALSANETLEAMRNAVNDVHGSVRVQRIISLSGAHTKPFGLQVMLKTRKIGPLLIPSETQTLDDLMNMLYQLSE